MDLFFIICLAGSALLLLLEILDFQRGEDAKYQAMSEEEKAEFDIYRSIW